MMKRYQKSIASLLIFCMMALIAPVGMVYAEDSNLEAASEDAAALTSSETLQVIPQIEEPQTDDDEVVYNLSNMEVTVGNDAEKAASGALPYLLFNEDGSFTIPLENNAFFPYEVQFTYQGETFQKWFMTPDDSVEIGGHTFYVKVRQNSVGSLSQIGVWIGDTYVPAYPEEKEFTNSSGLLRTLLPITEHYLTLDFTGWLPDELKNVSLEAIEGKLADSEYAEEKSIAVYLEGYGDDYKVLTPENSTFDLSATSRMELIAGTADQLDMSNIRYKVVIAKSSSSRIFDWQAVTEERDALELSYSHYTYSSTVNIHVEEKVLPDNQPLYVSMNLTGDYAASGLEAVAYEGYYTSEEEIAAAHAADISSQILNQTDLTQSGGYLLKDYTSQDEEEQPSITIVFKRDGKTVSVSPYWLRVGGESSDISLEYVNAYKWTKDGSTYTLKDADSRIYLRFQLTTPGVTYTEQFGFDGVEAAYVGDYASQSEVPPDAEDIKAQLFGAKLYPADFSNGGISFTFFITNGEIIHRELEFEQLSSDISFKTTTAYDYWKHYGSVRLYDVSGNVSVGLQLATPGKTYTDAYGLDGVVAAYVGDYASQAEVPPDAEDIKAQLFSETGYQTDYSEGITFTVVTRYGEILHYTVEFIEQKAMAYVSNTTAYDYGPSSINDASRWIKLYDVNGELSLSLTLVAPPDYTSPYDLNHIAGAYAIDDTCAYASVEEVVKNAENIKDKLFSEEGYRADYSKNVEFMCQTTEGDIFFIYVDFYKIGPRISSCHANGAAVTWDNRSKSYDNYYHYYHYDDCLIELIGKDSNVSLGIDGLLAPLDYTEKYDLNKITAAYVGDYDSLEDVPQDAENIKDQLFSAAGYQTDYSDDVEFTIFTVDGDILHWWVAFTRIGDQTLPAEPTPGSADTYFRVNGVQLADGTELAAYVMPYDDDTYYYNGYQTLFLLQETDGGYEPVAENEVVPVFTQGRNVHIYAGQSGQSGELQESGVSVRPFASGQAVLYSAAAENGVDLKNYWVTFLTPQSGPKLFVNGTNDESHWEDGMPVREVFLTDKYDNYHDIFIANVGDEALTGLYVRLEDAQNVQLDEYWTISENAPEENRVLNPFTKVTEPDHIAKIRLLPTDEDSNGIISGTLTIGADGIEPVKIKLTGIAGDIRLVTDDLVDGVKYVPYSSVLQSNNMYASNAVTFTLTAGSLPDGVILKPNGEVYGVPTETGEFTFTVEAAYNIDTSGFKFNKENMRVSHEYTLTVLENTDENVDNATDTADGYALLDRVADMTAYSAQLFRSEGEYDQFVDFWLDGEKLEEGKDYDSEEGSTKITIRSATFQNAGTGSHTIAAEFRTGGKEDTNSALKRTAQNYTVTVNSSTSGASSSGGGGGGGGHGVSSTKSSSSTTASTSAGTTSEQAAEQAEAKQIERDTVSKFIDVAESDWYYQAVKWAYDNQHMVGVSDSLFAPNAEISHATIVSTLARLGGVDLISYKNANFIDIENNQWYSEAAKWAKMTGLLNGEFQPYQPMLRGELAVMLVKYLVMRGIEVPDAAEGIVFADAEEMTEEENRAFNQLYQLDIFKGKSEDSLTMDPKGCTTRAELATLLRKVDGLVQLMQNADDEAEPAETIENTEAEETAETADEAEETEKIEIQPEALA